MAIKDFKPHTASKRFNWDDQGGYDPLGFPEHEAPQINPETKYGGTIPPSFYDPDDIDVAHRPSQKGTEEQRLVDLAAQGQNKDDRANVSYGSGVDTKTGK